MRRYELEIDTIPKVWSYIKGVTEFKGYPPPSVKESERRKNLEEAAITRFQEIFKALAENDYDKMASMVNDADPYYTKIPLSGPTIMDYFPDRKARINKCTTSLGKQIAGQFELLKNDEGFEHIDPFGSYVELDEDVSLKYHQMFLFYYANAEDILITYDLASDYQFNGVVLEVKFKFKDEKLFTHLDAFSTYER